MAKYGVAVISREDADREAVRFAIEGSILKLLPVDAHRDLAQCLDGARIVLWDADYSEWPWKQFLAQLRTVSNRPRFVLLTSVPNPQIWAEAINLGADDVLAKPLHADEVRHVIACADLRKPVRREAPSRKFERIRSYA
jgi:DNA-binding response OmpR family regulator